MHKVIQRFLIFILIGLPALSFGAYPYYGPTFENEHLYRIAMRIRPHQGVTVQQMMVALLRENPNAFVQRNINALKAGYRLHLPSLASITRISPDEATQIVNHQNKIWAMGLSETKSHIAKKVKVKKSNKVIEKLVDNIPSIENNKELASTQKATETQASPNQPQEAVLSTKDKEQIDAINSKLNNTIEANQAANQQTQKQLTAVTQQTQGLQDKVGKLDSEVQKLSNQVIELTSTHAQDTTNFNRVLLLNLKQNSVGLVAALVTLIFLTYLLFRTFKPSARARIDKKNDEYDFMSSRESIPAKLDLARAYIDMGDHAGAEAALNDVLKTGNAEQRKAAQELLGKLT